MKNILILLAGGYAAYKLLFKKDTVRTSGSVAIKAAIPYGYDLVQPYPAAPGGANDLRSITAQQTLTKSLVAQGAQNVTYGSAADGVHVHFLWTRPAAATVDIGKLAYGGAVVRAITRLDGKNWTA